MANPRTVYRASLETRNFEFEGFGYSRKAARYALELGLEKHAAAHNLAPDWYGADDIRETEFIIGAAYRDRELIQGEPVIRN